MMPDRVRAFVAIRMDPAVEQAVIDFIASMRTTGKSSCDGVRWVVRANLHVTLRFLGDRAAGTTLDRLDGALGEIATATTCFGIDVRGIGVFPNRRRPRVIWVGLESTTLRTLAAQVEGAAVLAGLAPEERTLHASPDDRPHPRLNRLERTATPNRSRTESPVWPDPGEILDTLPEYPRPRFSHVRRAGALSLRRQC